MGFFESHVRACRRSYIAYRRKGEPPARRPPWVTREAVSHAGGGESRGERWVTRGRSVSFALRALRVTVSGPSAQKS